MARIIDLTACRFSSFSTLCSVASACERTVDSGVLTLCAASAINSSDCLKDFSSCIINLLNEETSGPISDGTRRVTGLRSCGLRLATEFARFLSGLIAVDAAQSDNSTASIKKPAPYSAAVLEILLKVPAKLSCVCAMVAVTCVRTSAPTSMREAVT